MAPGLRIFCQIALAIAVVAQGGPVAAHGYKKKGIEIVHPWTMETSGPDALVRMTIRNTGKRGDKLLSASSSAAGKVELRQAAGGAQGPVVPLESIAIPIGAEVKLSADAAGLVLVGMKKSANAYDEVPLTLVFEKAGILAIHVAVEEAQAPEPAKK